MKIKYLFPLAFITVLMSCSTAYKTGQTPDDVYFSPAPESSQEYVILDEDGDEREIRSQMRSLRYRNDLSLSLTYGNQFGSFYNPYYSGYYPGYSYFGFSYGNPWFSYSPYYSPFSPYYNPYYGYYPYYPYYNYPGGKYEPINYNTGPRKTNLGGYTNTNAPRVPVPQTVKGNDGKSYTPTRVPVRQFPTTQESTNEPKSTGVGGFLRKVFTPSNSDGNKTTTRPNRTFEDRTTPPRTYENNRRDNTPPPTRTFTPAPTPPPSSGGGSAPVRTFRKN